MMSQTPSSEEARFPAGRITIGSGGIITDCRENYELLELIENTPALLPIELYTLAVSYQKVESNSGLGNRLAFIALNAIFQNPLVRPYLFASSKPVDTDLTPGQWLCCVAGICFNQDPNTCPHVRLKDEVKRVPFAGLELLVEITLIDEIKTYAILGVSPSILRTVVEME